MKYGYAYQRGGAPLLSWKNGPPRQTRAADAVSLGSLAEPTIALPLPRPGSPEPVGGFGGCACSGGVGDVGFAGMSTGTALVVGVLGVFAYYQLFKKKR